MNNIMLSDKKLM